MAQVSMTVRMDNDVKQKFDKLCTQFGMSANSAMNIFARAVVQRGRIPFEVMSDEMAAKTQQAIDKFWAEKQFGTEEIDKLLDEHLRTPYRHSVKE